MNDFNFGPQSFGLGGSSQLEEDEQQHNLGKQRAEMMQQMGVSGQQGPQIPDLGLTEKTLQAEFADQKQARKTHKRQRALEAVGRMLSAYSSRDPGKTVMQFFELEQAKRQNEENRKHQRDQLESQHAAAMKRVRATEKGAGERQDKTIAANADLQEDRQEFSLKGKKTDQDFAVKQGETAWERQKEMADISMSNNVGLAVIQNTFSVENIKLAKDLEEGVKIRAEQRDIRGRLSEGNLNSLVQSGDPAFSDPADAWLVASELADYATGQGELSERGRQAQITIREHNLSIAEEKDQQRSITMARSLLQLGSEADATGMAPALDDQGLATVNKLVERHLGDLSATEMKTVAKEMSESISDSINNKTPMPREQMIALSQMYPDKEKAIKILGQITPESPEDRTELIALLRGDTSGTTEDEVGGPIATVDGEFSVAKLGRSVHEGTNKAIVGSVEATGKAIMGSVEAFNNIPTHLLNANNATAQWLQKQYDLAKKVAAE